MLIGGSFILFIVLVIFLVNVCMIFMGMIIVFYFKVEFFGKNFWLGILLMDESFVLGMNKLNYIKGCLSFEWFNVVNLIFYVIWVFLMIIGVYLGCFIVNF